MWGSTPRKLLYLPHAKSAGSGNIIIFFFIHQKCSVLSRHYLADSKYIYWYLTIIIQKHVDSVVFSQLHERTQNDWFLLFYRSYARKQKGVFNFWTQSYIHNNVKTENFVTRGDETRCYFSRCDRYVKLHVVLMTIVQGWLVESLTTHLTHYGHIGDGLPGQSLDKY